MPRSRFDKLNNEPKPNKHVYATFQLQVFHSYVCVSLVSYADSLLDHPQEVGVLFNYILSK